MLWLNPGVLIAHRQVQFFSASPLQYHGSEVAMKRSALILGLFALGATVTLSDPAHARWRRQSRGRMRSHQRDRIANRDRPAYYQPTSTPQTYQSGASVQFQPDYSATRSSDGRLTEQQVQNFRTTYDQQQSRQGPHDSDISRYRLTIPNVKWRSAYGLIAIYGLRPHEVFSCDLSRFPLLQVNEGTKTDQRVVYPFSPEWADQWDLVGDLPTVSGKTTTDLGLRVTHAFSRYSLPFPPLSFASLLSRAIDGL